MSLIRFSINNPLVTNLLLGIVVILGVLAWRAMPQEMFPTVELDAVSISVIFEGASPEEVERQVTIPIEEEFEGMPEIDEITSTSSEGATSILIKLKSGTDVDQYMRDAQTALDQVTDLPEEAEEPELVRVKARFPVISLSLYGEVSRGFLYEQADLIKERMAKLPGVASVGAAGDREWEIWVEVNPFELAAHGVSLNEVLAAVRGNLRDLPGGSLKAREGDILLRGKGVAPQPGDIGAIAVRSNDSGGQLRLGEIAHIQLRLEEARTLGRFNGRPSVNLTVTKTVDASTIDVADAVRVFAAQLRTELPPTIEVGLFNDLSVYVKNRLNTVKSSGLVGLVLVLLSLYLFLNFRVALITAMGIPISFLVAVVALFYLGYTINMVSLFAFLIALGLIVDDAIIVTENMYRHMEQGKPAHEAARVGAQEVLWPVIASTATTVAAFMPMFSIKGVMGAFIEVIPVVVSAALLGSLWEAFGVLPSHAAELLHAGKRAQKAGERSVDWSGLLARYIGWLRWALDNRYFVALFSTGLLVVTIIFAVTRVPFQLFDDVDVGQFFINAEAPQTYSLDDTARLAGLMEQVVLGTLDEQDLSTLLTNVGVSFIDFNRFQIGSHYIQLVVDLQKAKPEGIIERFISPLVSFDFSEQGSRTRPTEDIINELREKLSAVAGIQRISIQRPQGGPAGADIEVGVTGRDVRVLRDEATRMVDYLQRLPGVHDVRQNLETGKLEFQYSLNARGKELGLKQSDLADAVRTGFLGVEAVHVTRGNKRVPVRVIYPETIRHSSELAELPLVLGDGRLVYLGDVADITTGRGMNTISRRDTRRLGHRHRRCRRQRDHAAGGHRPDRQGIRQHRVAPARLRAAVPGREEGRRRVIQRHEGRAAHIRRHYLLHPRRAVPLAARSAGGDDRHPVRQHRRGVRSPAVRLQPAVPVRDRLPRADRHRRQRLAHPGGFRQAPARRGAGPHRGDGAGGPGAHPPDPAHQYHHLSRYLAADLLRHRPDRVPVADGGEPGFRPAVRHRRDTDRHPQFLPDRRRPARMELHEVPALFPKPEV